MKNNFIFNFIGSFFSKLNYFTTFLCYCIVCFVTPELDYFIQHFFSENHSMLMYLGLFIVTVRFNVLSNFKNHLIFDLKLKLFLLKFKNVWKMANFIKIDLSKIYLYLIEYKLYTNINVIKFICLKFINFNLLWRPLFKRFSYFGNYKNSRAKFLK